MPERYTSETLRNYPGITHHIPPLTGVEAKMYNRLWRAMVNGQLKPGAKLREEVIGEAFGVSRTLVRKVLIIMQQEGIVDLPLNRGAYIAIPNVEDARNVFEALRVFGRHVVSELAKEGREISAADIERLQKHILLQKAVEDSGDTVTARILLSEFFMLLTWIHGNIIIASQYENLMTRVILIIMHFRIAPKLPKWSDFQKKLVGEIINKSREAAIKTFMDYHLAYEKNMPLDLADEAEVDLKAILTTPYI